MRVRVVAGMLVTAGVGLAPWPVGLRSSAGPADVRFRSHVVEEPPGPAVVPAEAAPQPPPVPPEPVVIPVSAPAPPAPPPPPSSPLAGMLAGWAAGPRLAGTVAGVSVWIDGLGEVATHNPDQPLLPASNQKILTAMSVFAAMPSDTTLPTELRSTAAQLGPVLGGDLVLVGGGDPTLTRRGPHSLDTLAAGIAARGIRTVTGALVGDESRYDTARGAPGWRPEHVPIYIGPLSALVVDRNQHRGDPAYAADPLPGNLACFRAALIRHGVRVTGPDIRGTAPPGAALLGAVASPPVGQLVSEMLTRSDNLIAELLLKEVGFRLRGQGTSAAGIAAGAEVLGRAHVPTTGASADGSGLSRANLRSARQWRSMLQAALAQPWGPAFRDALPVAGRSGTLSRRLRGGPVAGNVRAKTGWIDEARTLSGYLTTSSGRPAVFSILVNGTTPTSPVIGAIDDLVATIAADRT